MRLPSDLTTLEILGIAIQSEVQSALFYQRIKKAARGLLKDKLAFLVIEEKKHQQILEELYRKQFPGLTLIKPHHSLVPKPSIPKKGRVTISLLLKTAMRAERAAESFYLMLARKMNDTRSALLIRHLARMENSHYHFIKSEVNLLEQGQKIKELKNLYQSDKAVHIGV